MSKLPEGIRRLARPGDKPGKPTGRYQARYPVTVNGVTRQMSAGTFATLADAKDARSLQMTRLRTGAWVDPRDSRMTVRQWSEQWLAARPSTNRTVRSHLNARILPTWGEVRLEDVTALGLQHWVNELVDEGLMPATVRDYYDTFKQMLAKAVTFGKLSATPCLPRAVKLPPLGPPDIVVLTVEDMNLLEKQAPDRFKAMIHLGAWAGLRMGELIALRWQDILWDHNVIHVQQARKHDRSIGLPKNGKKRKVPVAEQTLDLLRQHRRDFGAGMNDLLFTTGGQRGGRPLDANNWRTHVWTPLVEACGFDPKPTPHDLRHGHAGLMVMQGMDWKVLSDRLGHHKPSFTLDVYGWRRPDSHEVSIAALERSMRGD